MCQILILSLFIALLVDFFNIEMFHFIIFQGIFALPHFFACV